MRIDELISEWMEFLFIQKGHQVRGVSAYATHVRAFFLWLSRTYPGIEPLTVTRAGIESWQKALFFDFGNVSNRTRASKLSALRSFFSWARYAGHRADDPTKGIPSPKITANLPQKFSTEELRLLFAAPDTSKLRGVRDLAILKVLYAAGPRVSELVGLDLGNVTDSGGYIRLQFLGGKNNKDRTITLRRNPSKTLREWIIARRQIHTDHAALFIALHGTATNRLGKTSIEDVLKKYAKAVGIDSAEVFVHKMRSTFASDLYDSGDDHCPRCRAPISNVDMLLVQLAMGHEDPKTTVGYIAISDRHLRKTAIPDKRFNEIEGGD